MLKMLNYLLLSICQNTRAKKSKVIKQIICVKIYALRMFCVFKLYFRYILFIHFAYCLNIMDFVELLPHHIKQK